MSKICLLFQTTKSVRKSFKCNNCIATAKSKHEKKADSAFLNYFGDILPIYREDDYISMMKKFWLWFKWNYAISKPKIHEIREIMQLKSMLE